MKKHQMAMNRVAGRLSATTKMEPVSLTEAALFQVKGGGGPQPPDPGPQPGNGDPGPTN